MLNKEIPKEELRKIKLLILDSDGVSIPRGTEISQTENQKKYQVSFKTWVMTDRFAKMINQLREKIIVCISSGRSLVYLQQMYSKIVGQNLILSAENGSLSLFGSEIFQHFHPDLSYFEKLAKIKKEISKLPISGFEPKQFILTVHSKKEIKKVYSIVKKYDLDKELKVMWNGEAFDIQSNQLSKATGLKAILNLTGLEKDEVIAIGDRVNDKELLEVAGISVSADPKVLKAHYWTTEKILPGEALVDYLLKRL